MPPSLSVGHAPYSRSGNAIRVGDRKIAFAPSGSFSYVSDETLMKFGLYFLRTPCYLFRVGSRVMSVAADCLFGLSVTPASLPFCLASLCYHIVGVVLMGSKKQMCGILAKPYVAFVKNAKRLVKVWIRSKVSDPVGLKPTATLNVVSTIAVFVCFALPNPAFIGIGSNKNFAPKLVNLLFGKRRDDTLGAGHAVYAPMSIVNGVVNIGKALQRLADFRFSIPVFCGGVH